MTKLATFTEAEQLNLDDVLAEFRDASPPEDVAVIEKGASGPTAGADPDERALQPATKGAEIGLEFHNGLCPFKAECYESLGLKTQHCAWNLDEPPTWRFCGGYKRRNGGIR